MAKSQNVERLTHNQVVKACKGTIAVIHNRKTGGYLQEADLDDLSMEAYLLVRKLRTKKKWQNLPIRKSINIASRQAYRDYRKAFALSKIEMVDESFEASLEARGSDPTELALNPEYTAPESLDTVFLRVIAESETDLQEIPTRQLQLWCLAFSRSTNKEFSAKLMKDAGHPSSNGTLYRAQQELKAKLYLWDPALPQEALASDIVPYKKASKKAKPTPKVKAEVAPSLEQIIAAKLKELDKAAKAAKRAAKRKQDDQDQA